MIATEHVGDVEQLGSFIYRLCSGKETYRLKRRSTGRRESLALLACPSSLSPASRLSLLPLRPCRPLRGGRGGFPAGVSAPETV